MRRRARRTGRRRSSATTVLAGSSAGLPAAGGEPGKPHMRAYRLKLAGPGSGAGTQCRLGSGARMSSSAVPGAAPSGTVDSMSTAVTSFQFPRALPGLCSPTGPAEPHCPVLRHLAGRPAGGRGAVDRQRTQPRRHRPNVADQPPRGVARRADGCGGRAGGSAEPGWMPAAGKPGGRVAAARRRASAPAVPPSRRPEMSGRTAARLLLAAGAMLVVIAATVFTVAGWARVGPLGRCAILVA